MSSGAKLGNQSRTEQSGGGNIVNKGPTKHKLYQPPNFLDKSGQSDNASTNRPKGQSGS